MKERTQKPVDKISTSKGPLILLFLGKYFPICMRLRVICPHRAHEHELYDFKNFQNRTNHRKDRKYLKPITLQGSQEITLQISTSDNHFVMFAVKEQISFGTFTIV